MSGSKLNTATMSRWKVFVLLAVTFRETASKPTCKTCTDLIDKFSERMEETKGQSSGAGNAAWEESRGIKWDTSEARLTEILENVCKKSDNKCLEMLEDAEEYIEEWWALRKNGKNEISLNSFTCVSKTKVCCEAGYFGKNCKECPGGAATPCSSHGECRGNGDRKGKGTCKCNEGYIGKRCAMCAKLYFKEENETSAANFSCTKCHESCAKGCSGPGASSCTACAAGYEMTDGGCIDVDECKADGDKSPPCTGATFCSNTIGSFECTPCDVSCDPDAGCTGSGASDCIDGKCAAGYDLVEGSCSDVDECAQDSICETGTYCVNEPGSHKCEPCHAACVPDTGCTNSQPTGCVACVAGWVKPEGRDIGCEDVDECAANPQCEEGLSCLNNQGSFTCYCEEPRQMVDGKCVSYADAPDANTNETAEPKDEL